MKKFIIAGVLFILIVALSVGSYFFYLKPIKITNVTYTLDDKTITATIEISKNVIDPICSYNSAEKKANNHLCTFEIPNEETTINIKSTFNEIEYALTPNVNQILDFTLKETKIYLAKGENKGIEFSIEKLGNPTDDISLISEDSSIVSVEKNIVKGENPGTVKVTANVGTISKEIEITVTDLITVPTVTPNKTKLKCNIYTEEQNRLLDTILEYKIQNAGYQTRAGVVAALRFLTLEFPYQLNYFYESGRLNNNTGGNYVDGEGRFYHKGLYLHSYKYSELLKIKYGPATWGCPLVNWQDESGFVPGVRYPNGLDCSGFIAWAFYNGGFDVGDTGAGDNPWTDEDLSDLGPHVLFTREILEGDTLKAGDIIASDGHIAMIGGIHDGIYYVGESTTYYKGVVMHPYTIDELLETYYLNYVIYMDDYYKEDGNYTEYWE